MDAKVLVVFVIVLVLAFSTARQGKHLNVGRIGGKTSMRSYILYNMISGSVSERISPKQWFFSVLDRI